MTTELLEHSIEYYVEKAFKDLFKVVFKGFEQKVALRSFVAGDDSKELPKISYPAIEFAAEPYVEEADGCGFGTVQITLMIRAHVDDDPNGAMVDKISANAIANVDSAALAENAADSITIKGLVKTKQTGLAVDADSMTREKTVSYSVPLASLQKA